MIEYFTFHGHLLYNSNIFVCFDNCILSDGFVPYLVDCTETVPDDWEDKSIAGSAVLGSHCYLKCKEGYRFADDDQQYLDDQNRRIIRCIQSRIYDPYGGGDWDTIDWDIFLDVQDIYGDCNGDYGDNCNYYPECIPDN